MKLFRQFLNIFRRGRLDADMAEEMRLHVELQTERNMKIGMNAKDARYAALRAFGGVEQIKERARDQRRRGLLWLDDLGRDFHYALRSLRKNPAFALVAIASLGLGIGANTAIFSVINAVMLKSLPVADPSALVLFTHEGKHGPQDRPAYFSNFPLYEFLRDGSRSLGDLLAFSPTRLRVQRDREAEGVSAQWVTPNYFASLGVSPALGRAWAADDLANPNVVVISDRFWRSHFAADPAVIGRALTVSGKPVTVVGVTPPEFAGLTPGTPIDLTLLLAAQPGLQPERGDLLALGRGAQDEPVPTWELYIVGRLQRGVARARAEAELAVLAGRWAANRGASDTYVSSSFFRAELAPVGKGLDALRRRFSAPLRVLAGLVGCVLLIACANLANLLLARAAARRREIAVRVAIGASRGRLIRQMLTESLMLTALGGAAGLLVGGWGSSFLVALIATGRTPVELNVAPDGRVLCFTLAVSILAGIAVGLVPALRGANLGSNAWSGGPPHARGGKWSLGQTLVSAQLALSLCLLVASGLFVANLRRLAAIDPGFRTENLLSVSFDWTGAGFSKAQMMAFVQRAVERAREVPGVASASATFIAPLGEQASQRWFSVRGSAPGAASTSVVEFNVVAADYFETMNLPLVRGRGFDGRDTASAPKVAIISEALARFCFGDADPVGQPVWIARDTNGPPFTIVGVARDAKQRDVREAPMHLLYLPITQSASWDTNLLVRASGNPGAIATELRRALAGVSADVPVREITTPQAQLERSLLQERLLAMLSGFFGPLALLLAAIGLYGLLAFNVAQRTREIGVRMALGARGGDVLRLVVKQGMVLVAVGAVVGLGAASVLARIVRHQLDAISPHDPMTLLAAVGVLAAVALLACWLPARRAAKVDPTVALRAE
ncbi:MAG TPA: ABC transporter permease [Lacunisphaera sp.]|nr:ABC transporter permease [Lacunisphaera sp.]